ncbi:uncharacterized protein [Dermacentor albipictus]|uniref:uncharacterized protein n=1 Tax=Dermacentor albipictus TaxID=60249 RepID=UPI0038FCCF48
MATVATTNRSTQPGASGPITLSAGDTIDIDGVTYVHPMFVNSWVDDVKAWPSVSSAHIVCYLIKSKACDLKEAEAYKSLDSYNFVQSGWVGQVLCHNVNADLVYLKADVRPSQAINQKPWTAWACVRHTGQVITAGCSCMAGKARVCSHVGAILWKVDMAVASGMTGTSCTDRTAQWNRGTKRNVEPVLLEDMDFKLQKRTVDSENKAPKPTRKFHHFGNDVELMNHIGRKPFSDLFNIPGTLLHSTLNAAAWDPRATDLPSQPRHSHADPSELPKGCDPCRVFYQKFVMLSNEGRASLEFATREQGCPLWRMARRLRITASNVKRVSKRESTDPSKAVSALSNSGFTGNAATKHGLKYEAIARVAFTRKTGLAVAQSGMVVSSTHPWLSASPDGICADDALVEIKCPTVSDCTVLIEKGKYDVKLVNGEPLLCPGGKNGYYDQVQFTMFCCGKSTCYFYVWSAESDVIVNVPIDTRYIEQNLKRLKTFYFLHLLPHLEDLHYKKKLAMCKKYDEICNL